MSNTTIASWTLKTAINRLRGALASAARGGTEKSAPVELPAAKPVASPPPRGEAHQGPDALQLGRLAGILHKAAGHSLQAERCHKGAAQRIDAALYELEQLRDELAGVIRVPVTAPPVAMSTFIMSATPIDRPADATSERGSAVPAVDAKAEPITAGRATAARSAA